MKEVWIVRLVPQIETKAPDGSTTWRNVIAGYPHGHTLTGNERTLYGVWYKADNTLHAKFTDELCAHEDARLRNVHAHKRRLEYCKALGIDPT